jgi:hypothetical protein
MVEFFVCRPFRMDTHYGTWTNFSEKLIRVPNVKTNQWVRPESILYTGSVIQCCFDDAILEEISLILFVFCYSIF